MIPELDPRHSPDVTALVKERDLLLAGIGERLAAFGVDVLPFALGAVATWLALRPDVPLIIAPEARLAGTAWVLLFLLYQGASTCSGRRSLGHRLLGLRVVSREGQPLSMGSSFFRAACYPVSVLLGLGLAWALWSPLNQAWHDLAAGSLVVEEGEKPALARFGALLGAFSVLAASGALGWWSLVYAPRQMRLMALTQAYVGLHEVSLLQKTHRKKRGRYAATIEELAPLSIDPEGFLRDIKLLLDPQGGVRITVTDDRYVLEGAAMDRRRSPVSLQGPR